MVEVCPFTAGTNSLDRSLSDGLRSLSFQSGLVSGKCSVSAGLVIHDRFWVTILFRNVPSTAAVRIVDLLAFQFRQLGYPAPDVLALLVKFLALKQRIKDAKIGLWIYPSAG